MARSEVTEARTRPGREVSTAAILDAAEELFSAEGFKPVSIRAIARRAGVSHTLVHQYVGTKEDVFRAVVARAQGVMVALAPEGADLFDTTSTMLRESLTRRRPVLRILTDIAMHGEPELVLTSFPAMARLVELTERAAAASSPDVRDGGGLDPRFLVACMGWLVFGCGAAQSWMLSSTGLEGMTEAEVIDGLDRVLRGILLRNVPGLEGSDATTGEADDLAR